MGIGRSKQIKKVTTTSVDQDEIEKEEVVENYHKRFRRFSGLSRNQLSLFMVSAFSFIVSFSWNIFVQNIFNTVIPPTWKNAAALLILMQFLFALFITFLGATIIAFVNSRRTESNPAMKKLIQCCKVNTKEIRALRLIVTELGLLRNRQESF